MLVAMLSVTEPGGYRPLFEFVCEVLPNASLCDVTLTCRALSFTLPCPTTRLMRRRRDRLLVADALEAFERLRAHSWGRNSWDFQRGLTFFGSPALRVLLGEPCVRMLVGMLEVNPHQPFLCGMLAESLAQYKDDPPDEIMSLGVEGFGLLARQRPPPAEFLERFPGLCGWREFAERFWKRHLASVMSLAQDSIADVAVVTSLGHGLRNATPCDSIRQSGLFRTTGARIFSQMQGDCPKYAVALGHWGVALSRVAEKV